VYATRNPELWVARQKRARLRGEVEALRALITEKRRAARSFDNAMAIAAMTQRMRALQPDYERACAEASAIARRLNVAEEPEPPRPRMPVVKLR
jgi:hypothetical protein